MTKGNPSNPADINTGEVRAVSPKAFEKGRVLNVLDSDEGGIHYVTVKMYDSGAQETAPVLTSVYGDIAVPTEGTDVLVLYGENDQPVIIGSWYAIDRVIRGETQLPEYNAGDRIVGNNTGSYLRVHRDGTVDLKTKDDAPINVDHHSFSAYLNGSQTIPKNTEEKIQFDSVRNNAESMLDTNTHEATVLDSGIFRASGTAEIQSAGQNKQYVIRLRNQDRVLKRAYRQSANKEPLTLRIDTTVDLAEDDRVWITVENKSDSDRVVDGGELGTEFEMRRLGDGT